MPRIIDDFVNKPFDTFDKQRKGKFKTKEDSNA